MYTRVCLYDMNSEEVYLQIYGQPTIFNDIQNTLQLIQLILPLHRKPSSGLWYSHTSENNLKMNHERQSIRWSIKSRDCHNSDYVQVFWQWVNKAYFGNNLRKMLTVNCEFKLFWIALLKTTKSCSKTMFSIESNYKMNALGFCSVVKCAYYGTSFCAFVLCSKVAKPPLCVVFIALRYVIIIIKSFVCKSRQRLISCGTLYKLQAYYKVFRTFFLAFLQRTIWSILVS